MTVYFFDLIEVKLFLKVISITKVDTLFIGKGVAKDKYLESVHGLKINNLTQPFLLILSDVQHYVTTIKQQTGTFTYVRIHL